MTFRLPSFAKVNLHLRVLGKRGDGFHDIFTVFQTVSLCDELVFEDGSAGVDLVCNDPDVPTDESNLIKKAAHILAPQRPARISLTKRIPMGGGLGGGSSNAATALIGLNRLWGLGRRIDELSEIGAEIGSDVPFFLKGGTAVGTGRGIDIEPISDFHADFMVILTPNVHVSTGDAYALLNAQNLTNAEANRILRVCRTEAESADFLQSALANDFETAIFANFPEIGRTKQRLVELGAKQALMSGSGASVFGIFDKEETRRTALKALDDKVNWRKFAVAAISREEVQRTLVC